MKEKTSIYKKIWCAINGIIALIAAVLVYIIISDGMATPLYGTRVLAHLLICSISALGINRAMACVQFFVKSKWIGWPISIIKWVGAVIICFVISGEFERSVINKSLEVIEGEFHSVVQYVANYETESGNYPAAIPKEFRQLNKITMFSYYHGKDGFMIECPVSSIDMDGSTVFYDSSREKWFRFHNDQLIRYEKDKTRFGHDSPESIYKNAINDREQWGWSKVSK